MAFHIVFYRLWFLDGQIYGTVGLDGRTAIAAHRWETKLLPRIQHLMRRMKRRCIAWIGPIDGWIPGSSRVIFECGHFSLFTRLDAHDYLRGYTNIITTWNQKNIYFSLLIAEPEPEHTWGSDFFFLFFCVLLTVTFFFFLSFLFILFDCVFLILPSWFLQLASAAAFWMECGVLRLAPSWWLVPTMAVQDSRARTDG